MEEAQQNRTLLTTTYLPALNGGSGIQCKFPVSVMDHPSAFGHACVQVCRYQRSVYYYLGRMHTCMHAIMDAYLHTCIQYSVVVTCPCAENGRQPMVEQRSIDISIH